MSPKRSDDPPAPSPFNNPFGGIAGMRDALPSAPTAAAKPKGPPPPAKAVIRLERKGRGGKEVTLVQQLELPRAELERWLKELKGQLGCGGTLEDRDLVLQGDQRDRARELLLKRGVKKVAG